MLTAPKHIFLLCFFLLFLGCSLNKEEQYQKCYVLSRLSHLDTLVYKNDTSILLSNPFVHVFSSGKKDIVFISTIKELHNRYLYAPNGKTFEDYLHCFVVSYEKNTYNIEDSFLIDTGIRREYLLGFKWLRKRYFIKTGKEYLLKSNNLSESEVNTLLYYAFLNNYFMYKHNENGNYYIYSNRSLGGSKCR